MISIVNLKFYSGDHVYVGRPSILQNNWSSKESKIAKYIVDTPEIAVECFKKDFYDRIKTDCELIDELDRLRGIHLTGHLILGCWCVPFGECHANIIKQYLESLDG